MNPADGPVFVVVDPAVRSKQRSDRIYPWFFVQRAAESNALRHRSDRDFRPFAEYLRRSQYAKINWKHVYENLKEAFSVSKLARLTIDLGENVLKTGRYSPEAILQDDGRFATEIAQNYVTLLAHHRPTVFIIRETQNIDVESLRYFLTIGEATSSIAVILEYTSPDNHFSTDHEKVILDTVTTESSLLIFDLLRLDLKEFRGLLQRYAPVDKKIEAAVEIAWDGNLRIIKELKYRLMLGRPVEDSKPLLATIEQNLELLPKRSKLLLSIIASNVEAIAPEVVAATAKRIDLDFGATEVRSEIGELVNAGQYIQLKNQIALTDEDLLEALTKSPSMQRYIKLTEAALRDFYLDVVKGNEFANVPVQTALRQAIALCARTSDIVGLRGLIKTLNAAVQQAFDQTLYVNMVAGVLRSSQHLSNVEMEELIEWASAAAYEVGDFATTVSLLESLPNPGVYELAVLACCYGEINRHEDALTVAQQLRFLASKDSTTTLVGHLVECANLFALDRKNEADKLHSALKSDRAFAASPLFGYVLRYTEIIKDFPACTADVLESAQLLGKQGFHKSAAYSALAAAMHLAYSGQLSEARQLISKAESELSSRVRDRQIVLNNSVVLELLTPEPYLEWCIEKLNSALFTVGDDFSRLALQNNRLICFWLSGNYVHAIHCAEIIERILEAPGFGNTDVYWTTCFNAWSFFNDIGDVEKATRFRSILSFLDIDKGCYASYWKARFGITEKADSEFDFLMQFKYHPEYLSHWVIDLDGLSLLKEAAA